MAYHLRGCIKAVDWTYIMMGCGTLIFLLFFIAIASSLVEGMFSVDSGNFIGVATLVLLAYFVYDHIRSKRNYRSWPTVDEYLQRNAGEMRNGIKCIHCGAKNIWQRGWSSAEDNRRIHYCKICNTTLYRTKI